MHSAMKKRSDEHRALASSSRVDPERLVEIHAVELRDVESAQAETPAETAARPGVLTRLWSWWRARRRRERKAWSPFRKTLAAATLVTGLAVTGAELIKHGHRELGEDFAVAAVLLLLLLVTVVCARHFLAQELE